MPKILNPELSLAQGLAEDNSVRVRSVLGFSENTHFSMSNLSLGVSVAGWSLPGCPYPLLTAGMLLGMHKEGMLWTNCLQGSCSCRKPCCFRRAQHPVQKGLLPTVSSHRASQTAFQGSLSSAKGPSSHGSTRYREDSCHHPGWDTFSLQVPVKWAERSLPSLCNASIIPDPNTSPAECRPGEKAHDHMAPFPGLGG